METDLDFRSHGFYLRGGAMKNEVLALNDLFGDECEVNAVETVDVGVGSHIYTQIDRHFLLSWLFQSFCRGVLG